MGKVIEFKKPKPAEKHKGKTLCRSGIHKWSIVTENKFDVKQGKLLTVFQCIRCGAMRTKKL